MSQRIPINIPTFISDQNYNPNRVLPRLFYFNGMVDCEPYYIESGSLVNNGVIKEITQFPYFDHYNVVTGSFPTTGSRSLLFLNENPVYGSQPTENLYTEYWSNYINLLYSSKTRLINASAIIPLADYFDMELNDIINWRGDMYHLRAINDYNLKTGECKIQLLGPLLEGALDGYTPPAPPVTESIASVSWSLDETNADATLTLSTNGSLRASASADSSGNFRLTSSQFVTASIVGAGTWSEGGPTTMSLVVSGSGYTFSGTSTTFGTPVTATFTGSQSVTYYVTASTQYNPISAINFNVTGSCNGQDAEVTMSGATGGTGQYQFNTLPYASEAAALAATTNYVTTSSVNFTGQPDGTYYYVVRDLNYPSVKTAKPLTNSCDIPSASLAWTFNESGPNVIGNMDLYVNGSVVESRSTNSSGVWPVYMGDTISVVVTTSGCTDTSDDANAYTFDIIAEAMCAVGSTTLTTSNYTVLSGDIGTTLSLRAYSVCSNGCV